MAKKDPKVGTGKNSKVKGILEEYNLTKDEGDELIMEARKIWLN